MLYLLFNKTFSFSGCWLTVGFLAQFVFDMYMCNNDDDFMEDVEDRLRRLSPSSNDTSQVMETADEDTEKTNVTSDGGAEEQLDHQNKDYFHDGRKETETENLEMSEGNKGKRRRGKKKVTMSAVYRKCIMQGSYFLL